MSPTYDDVYQSDEHDVPLRVGFSDWEFTLFGHTPEWRRYRRQFHQLFHKGVVADYQPAQLEHARKLVRRLIQDPDHFISHLRQ